MWFVYMVRCADNTLYTGITNNFERRISEHNKSNTRGSKYVRHKRPVVPVYMEKIKTKRMALIREFEIKKLKKIKKLLLINAVHSAVL